MITHPPLSYAEAEAFAAALVAQGYSARSYPHQPTGFRVIVRGRHGAGRPFNYIIASQEEYLAALENLRTGRTGGDKGLTEGR